MTNRPDTHTRIRHTRVSLPRADTAPGNVNVGGSLYALHPTTGALLWNYTVRDGAPSAHVVTYVLAPVEPSE
jgi:outer membrane protein assembly factor BamB